MQYAFTKFAAAAIIIFAVFNLNNALALTGTQYTIEYFAVNGFCLVSFCNDNVFDITTNPSITINDTGYTPRSLTVKAGEPVSIQLHNTGGRGCTQAFTIPQLGVQKIVPVGKSETISFTAPDHRGQLSFMCSMGMYRGVINVI